MKTPDRQRRTTMRQAAQYVLGVDDVYGKVTRAAQRAFNLPTAQSCDELKLAGIKNIRKARFCARSLLHLQSDTDDGGPNRRVREGRFGDDQPRAPGAAASLHHGGGGDAHHADGRDLRHAHDRRHLPEHRHPGRLRRLELQRPQRRGHGAPRGAGRRARLFHDGQRHRAHRVAVDPGAGHPQDLLPAGRQYRRRHRADFGAEQRGAAHRAAGHAAAEHHPVQRVERAGGAGHAQQQDAAGADAVGLRQPVPAPAAVHDPGAVDPGRVRRQAAPDHRRGRHRQGELQGPLADGRGQCDGHDQRDRAGGHRAARNQRIQHPAQFQPEGRRPVQLSADRRSRRHPGAARRRRQGQRQLRAADQHRPHQRTARELPADPQEQHRLDAGGGRTPSRTCCRSFRRSRRRAWNWRWTSTSRCSCARRSRTSIKEAIARLGPRLADDPDVPRQLAQHRDRRDLDPAVDLRRRCRPLHDRPDHQPDDAGRAGAGDRHAGRQRHRRDGEHPPQPDAGQAGDGRHPRRLGRGDPAADGRDACASASCSSRSCSWKGRRASCSFRSPSPSCWRCSRPTSCRSRWCRRWRASCSRTSTITPRARSSAGAGGWPNAFDRTFDRFRDAYGSLLSGVLVRKKFVLGCFAVFFAITARAGPGRRHRFLPASRRRHPQAARARARRATASRAPSRS